MSTDNLNGSVANMNWLVVQPAFSVILPDNMI